MAGAAGRSDRTPGGAGRDAFFSSSSSSSNAEGEEHQRQRRLQLPFSFTTGEGVLYNTGPVVDVAQFQFNQMFSSVEHVKKNATPHSLLDCFLSQDQSAYLPTPDTPLPVDQVFMDSQALIRVSGDSWQGGGAAGDAVIVKEEAKQSVMAVINDLEKMARDGDFCAALQNLDVSDAELMEWENTLKRLGQDGEPAGAITSDLESVLTNDIFDFIDSVLFKEKGDEGLAAPGCLAAAGRRPEPFGPPELGEPAPFETASPESAYSAPMNGLYARQREAMAAPPAAPPAMFTQKLTHLGPLMAPPPADADPPAAAAVHQLQLRDIFSPSIELPELTVPGAPAPYPSCGRAPSGHAQTRPGRLPQNSFPPPAVAPDNVAMDVLPPLIPCEAFGALGAPNIPAPLRRAMPSRRRRVPDARPTGAAVAAEAAARRRAQRTRGGGGVRRPNSRRPRAPARRHLARRGRRTEPPRAAAGGAVVRPGGRSQQLHVRPALLLQPSRGRRAGALRLLGPEGGRRLPGPEPPSGLLLLQVGPRGLRGELGRHRPGEDQRQSAQHAAVPGAPPTGSGQHYTTGNYYYHNEGKVCFLL